uniref:Uncharacterized protein n=1 Tax=Opuntia streptacantha TaxID=393608 RepID=A0A7C9AWI8_OPUST
MRLGTRIARREASTNLDKLLVMLIQRFKCFEAELLKLHSPSMSFTKSIGIHVTGMSTMTMTMSMSMMVTMATVTMIMEIVSTFCFIKHLLDMFWQWLLISFSLGLWQR